MNGSCQLPAGGRGRQIKGQNEQALQKGPPAGPSDCSVASPGRRPFWVIFQLFPCPRRSLWSALFKSSQTRRGVNENIKLKEGAATQAGTFGIQTRVPSLCSPWLPTAFAPTCSCSLPHLGAAGSPGREGRSSPGLVNIPVCPAGKSPLGPAVRAWRTDVLPGQDLLHSVCSAKPAGAARLRSRTRISQIDRPVLRSPGLSKRRGTGIPHCGTSCSPS